MFFLWLIWPCSQGMQAEKTQESIPCVGRIMCRGHVIWGDCLISTQDTNSLPRKKIEKKEKAWQASLPTQEGLTVSEIFSAISEGKIKALIIMGENPIVSDPDSHHIELGLRALPFLTVIDIFMNHTAEFAEVVLPRAAFAEKDGTFTNTKRRVQRINKAVEPPRES